MSVATAEVTAYRPFPVSVAAVRRLTPSFLRVTFTGPDLDRLASNGCDQRIKLALPLPGRGLVDLPAGGDWYRAWRELPEQRRNPLRTYTVRATRPAVRELDVDVVLHGGTGPAAAWAGRAVPGDEVVLIGPNAAYAGPTGGFEWRPPAGAGPLLLAGDETAVPAVCAIAEQLPAGAGARILLEVPTPEDVLDVALAAGTELTWLPRRASALRPPAGRGDKLRAAVAEAVARLGPAAPAAAPSPAAAPEDVDVDAALLWEVPADGAGPHRPGPYAWLAGEAGVVRDLRRHLLQDVGFDRRAVAFMGYWRRGRTGTG